MTDDAPDSLLTRLNALERDLREAHARIAALTSRVYHLEQGTPAPPLAPAPIHRQPVHQQPVLGQPASDQPLPASPPPPPTPEIDWESNVGTNWLNRIGVLLLVIGITLFLSYAMAYLGPAGKIAIGITVGAALLATGYWYEHKGNFRPFSLGMLAGGFAILYATAFAAHAVEASRVIHNPYLGMMLQSSVALAALWQAVQFNSERAAGLGLLAAYLSLANSPSHLFTYIGCYPLTLGGLYLCFRMSWRDLPFAILFSTWSCQFANLSTDWDFQYFGRPVAWFNLTLFTIVEIRQRLDNADLSQTSPRHIFLLAANAACFLLATFSDTTFTSRFHASAIFTILTLFALATSAYRHFKNIRAEALSEVLVLAAASLALLSRFADQNNLLLVTLLILLSAAANFRNAQAPTLPLTLASEGHLAIVTFATLATFVDSRLVYDRFLRVHEALPQALLLTLALFLIGRFASSTPWPSWAGLVFTAVITLNTIPDTAGTIVLALEAILALAIGLRFDRRPIRLGAIALFVFAIGKVFFYDLANLDTLPRIFSFIVLGLLLISASWAYTRYREHLQKYL